MSTPPLASASGVLPPLLDAVTEALAEGARRRQGPLPAGGPEAVAARVRETVGEILPADGDPRGLARVVRAMAEAAADPADPLCAAHLHCPPLAVAAAADLAASVLNPSLDSWDQAPGTATLEELVTRAVAREAGAEDALVTSGGTESNQLALLLAREARPGIRLVHGANAHHSLPRAAWLLGLPEPVELPTPAGVLDPDRLDEALAGIPGPYIVAVTAGTTDAGLVDPLPRIADVCARHGARLHIDAAYGGGLLFSARHRPLLDGTDRADTVSLDLHKLGWQPIAAGFLAVRDIRDLTPLGLSAPYLNADDDVEAGLPDLVGRSLRTSRRPDVLKIAATFKTLGRVGIGALVDQVILLAREFAQLVEADPRFELHDPPVLSTVLFRPAGASDDAVATVRRELLHDGRAVLGRASADGRLWLKTTFLNPAAKVDDLAALLALITRRYGRKPPR
jgi:L-2,4-diaminobutyrate decarboxylase